MQPRSYITFEIEEVIGSTARGIIIDINGSGIGINDLETLSVNIYNVPKKFKNTFNSDNWEVCSKLHDISYEGRIKNLNSHKNQLFYSVDWETIRPLNSESEKTVNIGGEEFNRLEFSLMYAQHTCMACGSCLKFEEGNVMVDVDIFVCPSCNVLDESYCG